MHLAAQAVEDMVVADQVAIEVVAEEAMAVATEVAEAMVAIVVIANVVVVAEAMAEIALVVANEEAISNRERRKQVVQVAQEEATATEVVDAAATKLKISPKLIIRYAKSYTHNWIQFNAFYELERTSSNS